MAKPTKNAMVISIVVGLVALIGVILGLVFSNPLIALFLLIPVVGYEVYRVEGDTTRWAAWGILAVLIAEMALVIFNVSFDLAAFLGTTTQYFQGYQVPLTDIKLAGPIAIAIMSVVLFQNTGGRYTKILSVVIFLAAFAILHMINPDIFQQILKIAVQEGVNKLG